MSAVQKHFSLRVRGPFKMLTITNEWDVCGVNTSFKTSVCARNLSSLLDADFYVNDYRRLGIDWTTCLGSRDHLIGYNDTLIQFRHRSTGAARPSRVTWLADRCIVCMIESVRVLHPVHAGIRLHSSFTAVSWDFDKTWMYDNWVFSYHKNAKSSSSYTLVVEGAVAVVILFC